MHRSVGDVHPAARHSIWHLWRLPRVPALLLLALITLAGGLVRFMHLDRPCLWGDEALVYWRICGTYEEMLTPLKSDGFGPLHYELLWTISRFVKPTPIVLRLAPAICGTLLVPAIYFLARQMLPKSTSLLAAGFAACSGFAFFYSRDAKMYMQTWCFATLSAACLLWWLRSARSTAWLGWVAAGCIACGTHATAMPVVALSPLFLLTQSKVHWRQGLLVVAGLALIFTGPIGYYAKFNEYIENIEEGGWRRSGIFWVDSVNAGMTGPEQLRNAGTALLMGWTWPGAKSEKLIPPGLLTWSKIAASTIAGILLIAMLPWPRRWRPREQDDGPEPGWRVLLWLSLWILVPGYAFYCHSIDNFESPMRWLPAFVTETLGGRWWIVYTVAAVSVYGWFAAAIYQSVRAVRAVRAAAGRVRTVRGTHGRAAGFSGQKPTALPWMDAIEIASKALVVAVLFGALLVVYLVCRSLALDAMLTGRSWHSIWMPRYLGFLWPALAVAVAALLMRLPTRALRAVAIVIVLGVNLAFGTSRFLAGTEPPVDQMAKDVFDAQESESTVRTFTDIPSGDPNPGGGTILSMPGRYYLQLSAWKQPMSPPRFLRSMNEYRYRGGYRPALIAEEIRQAPHVTRIIKWDDFSNEGRNEVAPTDDALSATLSGWRLVSDRWYPVHAFWGWQRRGNFRRREYERVVPLMTGLPG